MDQLQNHIGIKEESPEEYNEIEAGQLYNYKEISTRRLQNCKEIEAEQSQKCKEKKIEQLQNNAVMKEELEEYNNEIETEQLQNCKEIDINQLRNWKEIKIKQPQKYKEGETKPQSSKEMKLLQKCKAIKIMLLLKDNHKVERNAPTNLYVSYAPNSTTKSSIASEVSFYLLSVLI